MASSIIVVSIMTNHSDFILRCPSKSHVRITTSQILTLSWVSYLDKSWRKLQLQGTSTSSCIGKVHIPLFTWKQLPKHRRRLQGLSRNGAVQLIFFGGGIWVQKIFRKWPLLGNCRESSNGSRFNFSAFKDIKACCVEAPFQSFHSFHCNWAACCPSVV